MNLALSDACELSRAEPVAAPTAGDRAATPSQPQPRAGGVLAVDLGGTKCHGVLADLSGAVLSQSVHPTDEADAARTLVRTLDELHSAAGTAGLPIGATVLGIPALIAPHSGLVVAGPNVRWHGFDLQQLLRERLTEPFFIENDVNLAALGEAWHGHGRHASSFVSLSIGTGVGAAVVMNGQVWRGFHNAAGEVGYMPSGWSAQHSDGPPTLEDRVSGPAVTARAAASPAESTGAERPRFDDARAVFAAAAASDPAALAVVQAVLHDIAHAIVAIVAVVDPEVVVLDGSVGRALDPWLATLTNRVAGLAPFCPRLVISDLEPNATVVGAIGRGLQTLGYNGQRKGDRNVIDASLD